MAYNGYPMAYPYYQTPVMPVQVMPQQVQPTTQQQFPINQAGFVRVRDENEARMYPVAPGNSVTFVNENSPYCYTKTVNMGQLDRPIFEKYRLVKEDDGNTATETPQKPAENPTVDLSKFALAADFEAIKAEIDGVKADIETFRGDLYGIAGKKKTATRKEVTSDE